MDHSNRDANRAVVFAPFLSVGGGENRSWTIAAALAKFMPTDVVTSDFDHSLKTRIVSQPTGLFSRVEYLKTLPYRNNSSVARLVSHVLLGLRAGWYFSCTRRRYNTVYVSAPLNVMAWLIFCLAGRRTKIIDIIDIWPDALPLSRRLRLVLHPFLSAWRMILNAAVYRADIVLSVSDGYKEQIEPYVSRKALVRRFYIGHAPLVSAAQKQRLFTIAYVGNLGRLYDFETLMEALSQPELKSTTQLFVVGLGDRQEWLAEQLKRHNIQHRFFGPVFEGGRLAEILRSCHAGFNGYINTTATFSYKANTYLAAGLPLVNSMTGDLRRLVAEHHLGENYVAGDHRQLMDCLLRLQRGGAALMAANCEEFFASHLEMTKTAASLELFLSSGIAAVRRSRAAGIAPGETAS